MSDTSVKKVNADTAPTGELGQKYLASGKQMAMRLWEEEPTQKEAISSKRDYETIGYVIRGEAELELEGQKLNLEPGDCWVVPPGAQHRYQIRQSFAALETTSPPARMHGRDEHPSG